MVKEEVQSPKTIDMLTTTKMVESIFYLSCVGPMMLTDDYEKGSMESYNLTS